MAQINLSNTKIFADGANVDSIKKLYNNPLISGFTTNPTLMRAAGIQNYKEFALDVLNIVTDLSVSFEVFADDLEGMEAQALEIASWAKNVAIKIPITNTKGISTIPLIQKLSSQGVICNVTAIFTLEQFSDALNAIDEETPAILSIFAGRIADTGVDPLPIMKEAVERAKVKPLVDVLWASPRELLNIFQADEVGCQIITVTYDLLNKLTNVGKDLSQFSLETVEMFYRDAKTAGYTIDIGEEKQTKETEIIILPLATVDMLFEEAEAYTEKHMMVETKVKEEDSVENEI